jgi:hypothetical protein
LNSNRSAANRACVPTHPVVRQAGIGPAPRSFGGSRVTMTLCRKASRRRLRFRDHRRDYPISQQGSLRTVGLELPSRRRCIPESNRSHLLDREAATPVASCSVASPVRVEHTRAALGKLLPVPPARTLGLRRRIELLGSGHSRPCSPELPQHSQGGRICPCTMSGSQDRRPSSWPSP